MLLREMGDYKTTRLLVCCALDRIWSSTQRLENLDCFGPEMPYVQYGVVFSLYCSRARMLKVQRGAYKLVKQCRTRQSPTLSYVGGFLFYSPKWGPIYRHLALCLDTAGVQFVLVSRRGPLGRSGVGRLDAGDILGKG